MDISETIQPRSDQQNYDDYIAGPKTVTVSEVRKGNAEQPVEIHLVEFPGRPFKPSKTVRRVLVAAWGSDASQYAGRRMTLYGDPTVKWAGSPVGGIRVSHLSHIEKPLTLALTETRGKRAKTTINPLPVEAPPASTGEIPQDVIANAAKAKAEGNLGAYVNWLEENNAPAAIIGYVKDQEHDPHRVPRSVL